MAKPQQQRKSKYIKQNVDKAGPNFIASKTPRDMLNEMPRILADFANKNIALDEYGYMFLTPQFIQGCKQYCEQQMQILFRLNKGCLAIQQLGAMDNIDYELYCDINKKYEMYQQIYATIIIVDQQKSYEPMRILQNTLNRSYRNYIQRGTNI